MNKGQFEKNYIPWNKNKKGIHLSPDTEFVSGDEHTGEKHPSWKGGIQHNKSDCTVLWDGNNKRKRRPKTVWEKHNGEIPKGFIIYHIDGNKDNDSIENLEAISRAELLKRNRLQNKFF